MPKEGAGVDAPNRWPNGHGPGAPNAGAGAPNGDGAGAPGDCPNVIPAAVLPNMPVPVLNPALPNMPVNGFVKRFMPGCWPNSDGVEACPKRPVPV
jgi:hypothetical protein